MTVDSALRATNLAFSFASGQPIFESLSLEIRPREILGVMGPSGCGKTTLLRVLSGFVRPQQGTVEVGGEDISAFPPRNRPTSMVFQQYALFPHMTVAQNIGFGPRVKGVATRERERRTAELLRIMELEAVASLEVERLSGGQRQRVAIARALAVEPCVIFLDEPLSAVDERLRDDLRALIVNILRKKEIAAILVSHAFQDTASMCDRICFWEGRALSAPRSVAEWVADPQTVEIALTIGYKNICTSSWWSHAIVSYMHGRKEAADLSNSLVVLPEGAVSIDSPGEEYRSDDGAPSRVKLKGVVRGTRWQGPVQRVVVDVDGQVIEVNDTREHEPGATVQIVVDTGGIIKVRA